MCVLLVCVSAETISLQCVFCWSVSVLKTISLQCGVSVGPVSVLKTISFTMCVSVGLCQC